MDVCGLSDVDASERGEVRRQTWNSGDWSRRSGREKTAGLDVIHHGSTNSYPVLSVRSSSDRCLRLPYHREGEKKEERLQRVLAQLRGGTVGASDDHEEEGAFSLDTFIEMMKATDRSNRQQEPSVHFREGDPSPGYLTGQLMSRHETMTSSMSFKYDMFLSHLQRNGQDAIISMKLYLQKAQPGLRMFIDLECDMRSGLTNTLRRAIEGCGCFLFFITDGILESEWCAQELRWAMELGKHIVLVRETDQRHGGIDMKEFFKQVPADLLHVFKNNIAIPWYREPAFRDVSVRTILNAANIADSYERDLHHLNRCRTKLEELITINEDRTTAFDVIQEQSWPMRVVFWLSGFQRLSNRRLDFAYAVIFNLSFWFCGLMCATNLVYQSVPYHVTATDLLTAYVHFPGWQGWLAWRKYVRSHACAELLGQMKSRPDRYEEMRKFVRVAGWIVLAVQVLMISVVLGGFSLPRTLGLEEDSGNHVYGVHTYTMVHAWVMWIVIPPVIASIFASYFMFAFVALMHVLDLENLKETVSDSATILARFYCKVRDDSSEVMSSVQSVSVCHSSPKSLDASSKVDDLEAKQRQMTLEARLFDSVLDVLGLFIHKAQGRVDNTCRAVSLLWVHLVLFSTLQVLAISNAASASAVGIITQDYHWWWALQDFFHCAGGLVLLASAMGMFGIVTIRFQALPTFALGQLVEAKCPPTRQVEVTSYFSTRPLGMHILGGTVYVDGSKAAGFFLVILIVVVDSAITMVNTIDMRRC